MAYFIKATIDYTDNLNGTYTLRECLEYVDDDYNILTVPAGFTWDGATIPRAFWRICGGPMHPNNVRASCLHDWLYGIGNGRTRKQCDKIFYKVLLTEGKNPVIAYGMYLAVRVFGSGRYQ